MPRKPPSPHDALVKEGFSVPEHAAAELKAVLPAALAESIEWATLRIESGSFVDKALEQSHSDLLYSVRLQNEQALLYVLFEHMSETDARLPLRVLRYQLRILERWARQHSDTPLPLPPVIAVVLHHSESGWRGATDLHSLFGELPQRIPAIKPYLPQCQFLLDDISRLSDDQLLARAMGAIPTLVLVALRDSRSGDKILRTLVNFAEQVRQLATEPLGPDALTTLYCYISGVTECSPEAVGQTFIEIEPATESYVMTAAQILEQRGFDKGIVQGKAEGVALGKAEVLERLLTRRFGPLSAETREQLHKATAAELELWTDRVLFADSLDAVFVGAK